MNKSIMHIDQDSVWSNEDREVKDLSRSQCFHIQNILMQKHLNLLNTDYFSLFEFAS